MKIGLLLPRSVLYPAIAFDLHNGLKAGLSNSDPGGHYTIATASIGVAAKSEEVYARCEQLLLDGAEIIIAYINPLTAEFIHPLFEASGHTLLVLDSGYHFPTFEGKLSHAYFLSLQGSLCCRMVAHKALAEGYRDFAYTCSFYDAGYRSSYTYASSVEQGGGAIRFNHITPLKRTEFTLDPLAGFLKENKDTAVLVSFCGDMTEDFFREGSKHDLFRDIPLYASPFTAEELWLEKIPYPGKDWSCVVPWSVRLDTPENKQFVAAMGRTEKANVFSLLAWEAALFLTAKESDTGNAEGLQLTSPRGALYLNPHNHYTEAPVYYATVVRDERSGHCRLDQIREADAVTVTAERLRLASDIESVREVPVNSWLNAYACLDS